MNEWRQNKRKIERKNNYGTRKERKKRRRKEIFTIERQKIRKNEMWILKKDKEINKEGNAKERNELETKERKKRK